MRVKLVPVALAILVVFSGCSGKPTPPTGSTDANPTPSSNPGGPPTNASLASIRFEDCWGGIPTANVPEERAKSYVPRGFQPDGFLPGTTQLNLHLLKCGRVVLPDRVVQDVAFLTSYVSVLPDNRSWGNSSTFSVLPFDTLVSNEEVAKALVSAGMAAEMATFRQDDVGQPGPESSFLWVAENDRVAYTVLMKRPPARTPEASSYFLHLWYGTNPYSRVDVRQSYRAFGDISEQDRGTIAVTGESRLAELLGAPVSGSSTEDFISLAWEIQLSRNLFRSA